MDIFDMIVNFAMIIGKTNNITENCLLHFCFSGCGVKVTFYFNEAGI